jgi:hypothetical protein
MSIQSKIAIVGGLADRVRRMERITPRQFRTEDPNANPTPTAGSYGNARSTTPTLTPTGYSYGDGYVTRTPTRRQLPAAPPLDVAPPDGNRRIQPPAARPHAAGR